MSKTKAMEESETFPLFTLNILFPIERFSWTIIIALQMHIGSTTRCCISWRKKKQDETKQLEDKKFHNTENIFLRFKKLPKIYDLFANENKVLFTNIYIYIYIYISRNKKVTTKITLVIRLIIKLDGQFLITEGLRISLPTLDFGLCNLR